MGEEFDKFLFGLPMLERGGVLLAYMVFVVFVTIGITHVVRGRRKPNLIRESGGMTFYAVLVFTIVIFVFAPMSVGGGSPGAILLFKVIVCAVFFSGGTWMLWDSLGSNALVTDQGIERRYLNRRPVTLAWADITAATVIGANMIVEATGGRSVKIAWKWQNFDYLRQELIRRQIPITVLR